MQEFDFCVHLTKGWAIAAMIVGGVLAYLFCGFLTIGIAGRWDKDWVTMDGTGGSPACPIIGIIFWPVVLLTFAAIGLCIALWATFGRISRWIAGVK